MYQISLEKQEEIKQFLQKYSEYYSPNIYEMLDRNLFDGVTINDSILQLYSYHKAIDNELNPYYDFISLLIQKIANLESKRILEVGCGYIPALSALINERISFQNKIQVYDPYVLPLKIPNTIKYRREFTSKSRNAIDLYLAMCPCEVLKEIVLKSIKTKREMFVQTCRCNGLSNFSSRAEFYYYIDSLIYKLQELTDYGFIIEKEFLDFSRMIDAPIILARKRLK